MVHLVFYLGGASGRGEALQNGELVYSRPAPLAGVWRILPATPSAASPHSTEEGCVVVALFCLLSCHAGFAGFRVF